MVRKRGQKTRKRLEKLSRKWRSGSKEHVKENLISRLPNIRSVKLLVFEWILVVSALILLAAIQSIWNNNSYSASVFKDGGTFTEATVGRVNSLNPLFATTNSEKVLAKLMFASLTAADYSGQVGDDLAKSVIGDETGKRWVVTLKEGLKWSDGEPITNKDVIYTVNLIQNPAVNTAYSTNLNGVKLTEEDGSLVFNLASAYVDFRSALDIPILPEHILGQIAPTKVLESDFSVKNPITSGPFSYNAEQVENATSEAGNNNEKTEKIVFLTANENYYKGRPKLDSFAVHAYTDSKNIPEGLKTGAVAATAELLETDKGEVNNQNILERETALNSGVFLFLNTKSEVLMNKDLRKAIQIGIDLGSLRAVAENNSALDYPILKSQLPNVEFPALPERNPEEAKAAVMAAGIDPNYKLQVATVTAGVFPRLAEKLKSELEGLGFSVDVATYEPGQDFLLNVVRSRNYDILLYEIELGSTPDLFAYYHSSQATAAGLNLSNYRNTLADDFILAARSTTNEGLRETKYASFLRRWVEDVPAIGLYQSNLVYYYNKNVQPFLKENKLVIPTDRFTDVNNWAVEKGRKNQTP